MSANKRTFIVAVSFAASLIAASSPSDAHASCDSITSAAQATANAASIAVTTASRITRYPINLTAGQVIEVWTDNLTTTADTVLALTDFNDNEVAFNDDCLSNCRTPFILASSIVWTVPTTGLYEIVMFNWNAAQPNQTATINVAIAPAGGDPTQMSKPTHTYSYMPVGGTRFTLPPWQLLQNIWNIIEPSTCQSTLATGCTNSFGPVTSYGLIRSDIPVLENCRTADCYTVTNIPPDPVSNTDTELVTFGGASVWSGWPAIVGHDDDGGPAETARYRWTQACTTNCTALAGGWYAAFGLDGGVGRILHDVVGPAADQKVLDESTSTVAGLDGDGDGVGVGLETILGLNTCSADSDGDAIPDGYELYGFGSEALAFNGAQPWQRDVFVQLNYMTSSSPTSPGARPFFVDHAATSIPTLTASFGKYTDIRYHVDVTGSVPFESIIDNNPRVVCFPFGSCVTLTPPAGQTSFDQLEYQGFFAADRVGLYRWTVIGASYPNANGSSGVTYPGTSRFIVSIGQQNTGVDIPIADGWHAATILHEDGHSLGLGHNGNGSNSGQNSIIHRSVMNYRYQLAGGSLGTTYVPLDLSTDATIRYATDASYCLNFYQAVTSPKAACQSLAAAIGGPCSSWVRPSRC